MSLASSGNSRYQARRDMTATSKSPVKCRIPQRLQSQNKTNNLCQSQKPQIRRTSVPETQICSNRPDRSIQNAKMSPLTRRIPNKLVRTTTGIPRGRTNNSLYLPNQATLKRVEALEVQQSQISYDEFEPLNTEVSLEVKESVTSVRGRLVKLKISWQEQLDRFDKMKQDLGDQQGAIMKLYASLCKTHKELLASGQNPVLPSPEELSIMNVAKLPPEQLLQICADACKDPDAQSVISNGSHTDSLAVRKFYDVSSKLVDTCKQAVDKRKSILDWFDNLVKSSPKGINLSELNQKLKESNEENETLKQCLEGVRSEFYAEMRVIVEYFRKAVNDAINNQLHAEDLTCKLSVLHSQNDDLKKSLNNLQHARINKMKIDELDQELNEERRKNELILERVTIAETKLSEKELALEKLNEHAAGLEQTIQELNDQNQQLQENFDKELNKLMESITKNTENLKEIAIAREKLQSEKENIEKRYKEQTEEYVGEISKIKLQLKQEVEKRAEMDSRYLEMIEKRKLLESILENLQKQLEETEKRHADAIKKIKSQDEEISSVMQQKERMELQKSFELDEAKKEIDNCKTVIDTQNSAIQRLQKAEREAFELLEQTKGELESKEKYIQSLEIKQSYLEDQLQKSQLKLSSYEEQLSKMKHDINQIQDVCGYFENLDELHDMINQQRLKLDETTDQLKLLAGEINRKNDELNTLKDKLDTQECDFKAVKHKLELQESALNEKEATIKLLTNQNEEHKTMIKFMNENIDLRTQTDKKLKRELMDQETKINNLIDALEDKKEEINHLNKIVFTLKEQAAKQKQNDQDVIVMLERKLAEVDSEQRQSISTSDNFDSLLQILEDELKTPYKNEDKSNDSRRSQKLRGNREKRMKHEIYRHEESPSSLFETEQGPKATKIVMGNFVKKTYITSNNEDDDASEDVDRKKAITNLETQRWVPLRGTGISAYEPSILRKNKHENYHGLGHLDQLKEQYFSRNIPFVIPSPLEEEKRSRMFRFAKHRM